MSRVNRRKFVVAGLAGMTASCYRFALNPTGTWLSVQMRGSMRLVREDSGGLTVLMIDANSVESTLPPHVQQLVTADSNRDKTSALPTFTKSETETGPLLAFWNLAGYQVRFPGLRDGKVVNAKTFDERKNNDPFPNPLTRGDVSFIPEIAKLTPTGKARVRQDCFAKDPRKAYIAARIHFPSGQLSSIFPYRKNGRYDQVAFKFDPPPPSGKPYRQALGLPRLVEQFPGGKISIDLEPFDESKPRQTIVLTGDNTFGESLGVEIRNEPEMPPACPTDQQVRVLDHFVVQYAILDTSDQSSVKPIPIADGENKPDGGCQNEYVWCPGGI